MKQGLTYLEPELLREAEDNPRQIRDERFDLLLRALLADPSMLEARPLIADANDVNGSGQYAVVAGNMRLRAIREILISGQETALSAMVAEHAGVPVYVKAFASDAERREWLLRDNASYGEWVPEELARLLAMHEAEGADVALLGFTGLEAESLLALVAEPPPEPGGHGDPDDAGGAPPSQPTTKPGDAWRLGDSVVLCADAAHPQSYAELLKHIGGWDAIWTDPPYGVGYDAEARESYFSPDRLAQPFGEIQGDQRQALGAYADWLCTVLENALAPMREGGAVYLCHADKMVEAASQAFRESGCYLSSQLIWVKSVLVFGRSDYHYKHEPLLYGWKEGAAHRWFGDRKQTTIIEAASDHYNEHKGERYVHPTQKPYELIRPGLENSTRLGDVVLDPFAGSGSTLAACVMLGRRCAALELDPRYVDVVCARYEALTGGERELLARAA